MKLTVKTQALIKALNEAIDAIPSASTEPSFKNFLLSVTDDALEVVASDGSVTLKTVLPAKEGEKENIISCEPGKVQAPAHFLLDIVKSLDGDTVTLEAVDTSLMTVSDQRTYYKVNTISADEYPDVYMDFDDSRAVRITSEDFKKLYEATSFAVAAKSSKLCFTGINIRTNEDRLYFLATDACRLAQMSVPLPSAPQIKITVPVKVLNMISKKDGLKEVELEVSESKALFRAGDTIFQSRIIPGEFPNLERIRPASTPYKLTVNSSEFLKALDRVTIVASVSPAPVARLTCSQDGSELVASSTNGDVKEPLKSCTFEGDLFQIAFNTRFVSEAVKALNAPKVTLSFAGEGKIFVVQSDDVDNDQIITPVRIGY